jgi:hypothetical protein
MINQEDAKYSKRNISKELLFHNKVSNILIVVYHRIILRMYKVTIQCSTIMIITIKINSKAIKTIFHLRIIGIKVKLNILVQINQNKSINRIIRIHLFLGTLHS